METKKLSVMMIVVAMLAAIILGAAPAAPVRAQGGDDTFGGISADSSPEALASMQALQAQWEADTAALGLSGAAALAQLGPDAQRQAVYLPMVAAAQSGISTETLPEPVKAAATVSGNGRTYSYMPTSSAVDGRMLSLAGSGLQTIGGDSITMKIIAPATPPIWRSASLTVTAVASGIAEPTL